MFLIFLGWFPREYVFFRGEASEIAVFGDASCFYIILEQLTARIRMMSNKNHMSRYNMCVCVCLHAYKQSHIFAHWKRILKYIKCELITELPFFIDGI